MAEAGGVDFVGSIGGQTVIAASTDHTDRGGAVTGLARLAPQAEVRARQSAKKHPIRVVR